MPYLRYHTNPSCTAFQKVGDELVIGTGDGLISILELQPEGKKIMSAKAFLQGRRLKEGTFFDEP